MTGRGGAGRGQGRKPSEPNLYRRMLIGARCEEIRKTASDKGAADRMRDGKLEATRASINAERDRQHAQIERFKGAGLLKAARKEWEKFAAWEKSAQKKLATAAKESRGPKSRVISLRRYRPKPLTRPQIYSIVAKQFHVSPRQARAFWIEHNKVLAEDLAAPAINAQLDDNL
jgi:hypothetical protein